MFKLVALFLLLAVVAAKPADNSASVDAISSNSLLHLSPALAATAIVHEPALAKVGEYVASVPTSISHQSSTIVHDRANVVTPIVTPALKTTHFGPVIGASYVAPVARSYPAIYQQHPFSFYYGNYPYTYKYIY